MNTLKDFILYVLFVFVILAIWTHYRDPEGLTVLGKLIAAVIR